LGLPDNIPGGLVFRTRTNFVLDLGEDFEVLHKGFHRVLRRKLRKYGTSTLSVATPETIIGLYQQSAGIKAGLKPKHYRSIRSIIQAAQAQGVAICCRLDDPEYGLLAAGFFPFYRGRLINTFAASSSAGYQQEGMARMLVELIRTHRGPGRLMDFEGSDIPGVAEFFKSFGPEQRHYLMVEKDGAGKWLGKF
jgi:hypothetical protein